MGTNEHINFDLVIVVIWGVIGALVALRRFQWAPRRT